MTLKEIDLTCPNCGGNMERDAEHSCLHCPYCGHEVLLEPTDAKSLEEKAYARQKGILQANEEAEKHKKRKKRKGIAIVLAVIGALILVSFLYNALSPKVDPFDYITVSFSGETGDGTAEVIINTDKDTDINIDSISYRIEPRNYLSEGDKVTVTASSSEYLLSPTSKTYTVKGLDSCLTDLSSISEKAVTMIHNKSDMTVAACIDTASNYVEPNSVEPCMMYLTTDGKNSNTLYDVYRAEFPQKEGGVSERFIVIFYNNIIVRDTDEPTMSYDRTMYSGQIIETLDKGYAGYITAYHSLKDAKADILSHQSTAVTLQEREAHK